jgi:hypothetical protein
VGHVGERPVTLASGYATTVGVAVRRVRAWSAWSAWIGACAMILAAAPAGAAPAGVPTQIYPLLVVGGPPLKAGNAETVRGAVSASGNPLAGATVHLMIEPYGSTTFTEVATGTSGSDGFVTLTTPPLWQNTSLRLDVVADPGHDASSSTVWEVPVSARASIRLSDRTPRVNHRVVVRGQTFPSRAGRRISVWTGIRPCWCDMLSPAHPRPKRLARGLVRADGSYRLVIRFSTTGRKRIYALVGGGDGLIAGTSRYRHLRVH